ncbi:hypothetical protein [Hydrogenophaga sp.]|uniref:hypothetical protein n=1 Tax=Hydrogenophaga sp. TaxID=1904254 RepID=UPI003F6ADCAB
MAEQTVNTSNPEPCDVYLEPRRVALLTNACDEIEQLTRVLGTLGNSIDSELVRRSVAVRVHDLNRVVHGALTDSEVNPFDIKKAGATVYGPAWWGAAA